LSDIPALKPYWGKPAVRNFRGGDGNVGIIRSPVRAIALPDNRHEAENAKFLRERTSDPLGPESCADTARDSVKRRQGYRRGGISSCENLQPGRRRRRNVRKCNMSRGDSPRPGSVRRSRRPQARLETSCTRTGRPRRHLQPNQAACRRENA
jgi:hypothetical protein